MNEVALRANDVLRNDVMLRINDVALRANGFPPQVLKNAENCDIMKSERRWRYEKCKTNHNHFNVTRSNIRYI